MLEPPLSDEHVAYVDDAASYLVGTCSADQVPEVVRAAGVRVLEGGRRVLVLVPEATGAVTLANVAAHPRVSLTTAHLPTFATLQVKGRVVATRPATEAERPLTVRAQQRFAKEFAWAGSAVTTERRLAVWPCTALEVELEAIFTAAPDPTR